jgi:tetratricopeptide (TPR) repeat protein
MERLRRLCHHTSATPTATNVAASARLDQDKLRLFLAVSRLTVRLAQRHPLVFLLDDLHWADQPSLELFGHLVFTVADAVAQEPIPLLIAGTYRPLEASPWLTRCLSRFQRESICRTVELSGFADADIVAFLQEMQVGRPSTQLITTMQQVTHGNPLFIQEVIHNLRQNDALHQRGGYLVASASAADVQLPEHITGVFAARLETLNEDCRRALTLAAFLGDRFSLPVLSAISGFGEEELLDVLEEGMHQRLLLNEDQDFQFAHPLIRHVFYHAPSVARRQRLHHWLAQALERLYADNLEAHILEIAHHLIRAGPVAEADTVAVYARRAGDRAFTAFAWDDAARYYEAALTAAESTGHLPDHDRADFHYQVAQAYHRAMDTGPGLDHYDRAIEAYQRTGDRRGLGLTLMEKARLSYYTAASHGTLIDVQPLEEVLELLGSDAPDLHGNIAAIMAEAYWVGQQVDKAEEMARYALATGRGSGDDRLCAQASHVLALVQALGRRRVQDALESWQNALVYARQADDLWLQGLALPRMALSLTMLGRLDEAEAIIQQARTVTHTTQDWSNYSLVLAYLAAVQVARGHFAAAEQHAQETLRMVSRSHYPWGGSRALFTVACAHALRGHWTAAEDALNMQVEPGRIFDVPGQTTQLYVRIFRQLLRSYAGAPLDEALESLAAELAGAANADAHPLALFCAMAEIAAMTATPTVATPAYQTMFVSAARHVVFTSGWMFLVPRVLGVVATLNRWWDKAETHFHTAIEVASGIGAQPELGRTYLDYARMLTARGSISDHDRAIELAKQACTIFHAYGMHPFAQGAEQLAKMRHSRTS